MSARPLWHLGLVIAAIDAAVIVGALALMGWMRLGL